MRIALTLEVSEGPSAQDEAERLMAATGHLLQDVVSTFHQLGVVGQVHDKRRC